MRAVRTTLALAVLAIPAVAVADDDPPNKLTTAMVSLDYALGTYVDVTHKDAAGMDVTETLNQTRYAIGVRFEIYDWTKTTPLGATPGLWFDAQLGFIAGDDRASGDKKIGDGGGGPLWDLRMSGPWKIFDTKRLRLGAGIGFRGGLELGLPAGTNRVDDFLALDASVMAIADVQLPKVKVMIEGEYAVGVGYVEQRAYGHVAFGHLALGAQLTVGQADINYFVFGLNLGFRGSKRQ